MGKAPQAFPTLALIHEGAFKGKYRGEARQIDRSIDQQHDTAQICTLPPTSLGVMLILALEDEFWGASAGRGAQIKLTRAFLVS